MDAKDRRIAELEQRVAETRSIIQIRSRRDSPAPKALRELVETSVVRHC